jgi:hypothetical protein
VYTAIVDVPASAARRRAGKGAWSLLGEQRAAVSMRFRGKFRVGRTDHIDMVPQECFTFYIAVI